MGSMYTELLTHVALQEEVAIRIDATMDSTLEQVEEVSLSSLSLSLSLYIYIYIETFVIPQIHTYIHNACVHVCMGIRAI